VVGKGTEILSQKKAREYLDIIGPLGNGFGYRTSYIVARTSILVVGGIGVVPLLFLAEKLNERNTQYLPAGRQGAIPACRQAGRNTLVLIGAKTKDHILCEKEFKKLGYSVKIATDDGSKGFKGNVTELLRNILRSTKYDMRYTIYACGPRPMLKEIALISQKYNIPAQVSLEEHMACGIGACLGCAVNTRDGYKRVCKEGPVFDAEEIIW
jgi:dihydroorotate dehydrogenase electron transfer subunit